MSDFCVILCTCANSKEAAKIAERLVTGRLAACVNIVGGVKSVYWWQGQVERSAEALLIIKSKQNLFDETSRMIRRHHTATCPEIIQIPIENGFEDYLDWVQRQTR